MGRAHLQQAIRGKLAALAASSLLQALKGLERVAPRVSRAGNTQVELIIVAHILVELVERAVGKLPGDGVELGKHALVSRTGQRREDDELRRLGKARHLVARKRRGVIGHLDACTSVVDARRGAKDDGQVVRLGDLEGNLRHEIGLFWRGGVEHGHMGKLAELARVLLGLA